MELLYRESAARIRRRYRLVLAGLAVVLVGAALAVFLGGYYPLRLDEVVRAFWVRASAGINGLLLRLGWRGALLPSVEIIPQAVTIFWSIRLPRILSAVFIGPPCR